LLISKRITTDLKQMGELDSNLEFPFQLAVTNACLLHDIGNPPFGHFGEVAITKWFKQNWETCLEKAARGSERDFTIFKKNWLPDLFNFNGNPQGLRTFAKLTGIDKYGLNLTYSTIMSFIKYPRSSTEEAFAGIGEKVGYFESEKEIIDEAIKVLKLEPRRRFPIAYIMDAADDISYCISDLEDGVEKGLFSCYDFFNWIDEAWSERYKIKHFPYERLGGIFRGKWSEQDEDRFLLDFKTNFTRTLIEEAYKNYIEKHPQIIEGKLHNLFDTDGESWQALDILKRVASEKLFCVPEVEKPELAGFNIITGILNCYSPLLECPTKKFAEIVDNKRKTPRDCDLEQRLFNRLPKKHVMCYKNQLKDYQSGLSPVVGGKPISAELFEWFLRAHLILDYIAGMTDKYSLEMYQVLLGIRTL